MGSISGRFSGIGSAINNSISRVGQPLLGALIFIPISAAYYASLGAATGLDTSDPAVRRAFQPLNPPGAGATADQVVASNLASIDAFHLAMLVCAGLLVDRRARVVVRAARAARGGRRATRRRRPSPSAQPRDRPRRVDRAARADGLTTDDPRLGRPDLRPRRRPADALGRRSSWTACRSTATSASSMPAAGAAASPSCSPPACPAVASSPSTGRRR